MVTIGSIPADERTEAEFRAAVISRYIPALMALATHKGSQYAGSDNPALVNFYEGSTHTLDTPAHYLITLATKQWHVLSDWSKMGDREGAIYREVVQRLFDIIVYLMLLLFMIEADGDVKLPGEEK